MKIADCFLRFLTINVLPALSRPAGQPYPWFSPCTGGMTSTAPPPSSANVTQLPRITNRQYVAHFLPKLRELRDKIDQTKKLYRHLDLLPTNFTDLFASNTSYLPGFPLMVRGGDTSPLNLDILNHRDVLESMSIFLAAVNRTISKYTSLSGLRSNFSNVILQVRSILCDFQNFLGRRTSVGQHIDLAENLHSLRNETDSMGVVHAVERDYIICQRSTLLLDKIIQKYSNSE